MTHSLGEAWALDDDRRDRFGDHTAHGFYTDLIDPHAPHASGAILGYGSTELCLQPRICYGSYSATEILLYSALLLHGAKLGSALDLDQLPTRKVGSTPLSELQLRDSGSEFGIYLSRRRKELTSTRFRSTLLSTLGECALEILRSSALSQVGQARRLQVLGLRGFSYDRSV